MRKYSSENILKQDLQQSILNDQHRQRAVMNIQNWIHYYKAICGKVLNPRPEWGSALRTITGREMTSRHASRIGGSTWAPCSGGKRLVHARGRIRGVLRSPVAQSQSSKTRFEKQPERGPLTGSHPGKRPFPENLTLKKKKKNPESRCSFTWLLWQNH